MPVVEVWGQNDGWSISLLYGMSFSALRFTDATLDAWSEQRTLSNWGLIASTRGVDSQLCSMRRSCNSGTRNRSSAVTVKTLFTLRMYSRLVQNPHRFTPTMRNIVSVESTLTS